jgi:hypothetical protein
MSGGSGEQRANPLRSLTKSPPGTPRGVFRQRATIVDGWMSVSQLFGGPGQQRRVSAHAELFEVAVVGCCTSTGRVNECQAAAAASGVE